MRAYSSYLMTKYCSLPKIYQIFIQKKSISDMHAIPQSENFFERVT